MQSSGSIRPISTDPFTEAIAAAIANPAGGQEALIQAFYESPRVRKLIFHACFVNHISKDDFDEIRQELAILLIEKFLKPVDETGQLYIRDSDKIYNVLHVTACNIAFRRVTKKKESSIEDLSYYEAGNADIRLSDQAFTSGEQLLGDTEQDVATLVEGVLDHQKAIQEFNRRLANNSISRSELSMEQQHRQSVHHLFINPDRDMIRVVPLEPRPPATQKKDDPEKNNDTVELKLIREKLDLTIPEMASLLSLTPGIFNSYLYGVVKNIPSNVIRDARVLLSEGLARIEEISKKFENFTMQEITDHWVKRLKSVALETDSDEDIQKLLINVLNVDRATLWRWRNRGMRPKIRQLQEYDSTVEKFVSANKQ